ncbi:MAG: hypothetical protein E7179_06405 [Erysipelotrichaceae bacterium]|jgi:hypothetical protein|nr:hypothetical protein [Erysipelotrichaceae bacterium]
MKKMTIIASIVAVASAAAIATFALRGGPKLNSIFEAKATSKSFTFNAATGSQFVDKANYQSVNVDTGGVSDRITTTFVPYYISSVAFGEGGKFVEAHPIAGEESETYYSLRIDINNLTHFEIDVGVTKDGGSKDVYEIQLRDAGYHIVKEWYDYFKLDGDGNGTKHIVWDKGDGDSTVVRVLVNLYFNGDSADASLYVNSLSLAWAC